MLRIRRLGWFAWAATASLYLHRRYLASNLRVVFALAPSDAESAGRRTALPHCEWRPANEGAMPRPSSRQRTALPHCGWIPASQRAL